MINQNSLQCSNSLRRIITEGFKEIVGGEDLEFINPGLIEENLKSDDAYSLLFKNDQLRKEHQQFLEKFGNRGSRGIAYRVGGASFGWFIRLKGDYYNLTDAEYRLKNYTNRCLFGFNQIAEFIKQNCGMEIKIIDQKDHWLVEISSNEILMNTNKLWGDFLTGLIREYLSWTSGGRFFVMNTLTANQDGSMPYRLSINKQPLGN